MALMNRIASSPELKYLTTFKIVLRQPYMATDEGPHLNVCRYLIIWLKQCFIVSQNQFFFFRLIVFCRLGFTRHWYEPGQDSLMRNMAFQAASRPSSEVIKPKKHKTALKMSMSLPSATWAIVFQSFHRLLSNKCILDLVPHLGSKYLAAIRSGWGYLGLEESSNRFYKLQHVFQQLLLAVYSDEELLNLRYSVPNTVTRHIRVIPALTGSPNVPRRVSKCAKHTKSSPRGSRSGKKRKRRAAYDDDDQQSFSDVGGSPFVEKDLNGDEPSGSKVGGGTDSEKGSNSSSSSTDGSSSSSAGSEEL